MLALANVFTKHTCSLQLWTMYLAKHPVAICNHKIQDFTDPQFKNVMISKVLILHFQGQDQILNSDSFKHCTKLGVFDK